MANVVRLPANNNQANAVGGFFNNLVASQLQRAQQRQSGQQFGQAFGQQFSGITNPQVQQFIAQQALQRQQGQQALNLQAAKPIPPATVTQLRAQRIQQLQAIPEAQRTKGQKDQLKKLLEGAAAVQISFGKSTASERTAIAETQASLDALGNLETLFNKSTTATGPITGRVETAKGFFGLSSDDQENLLAATSAFKNAIIKDITGAQMSEPEAKRIMKQIPDENDPPARWRAKAKQTRKNLKFIQKRRSEVLKKSGIVSPLDGQTINIRTPESQGASDEEILRIIGGQ